MQQETEANPYFQDYIKEMVSHPAWHGDLTGSEAEALLRFQPAGTYLLRQGEKEGLFYLSYVEGTHLYHLPVKIDQASQQWFYLNAFPHYANNLEIFIPEIMHRAENECHPLAPFAKTSL
jgi:hypothetical protein